ncbi:MAG TPA: hydrogenase maturation nickel metallochaperone HypA [Anaerolineae bacterium]
MHELAITESILEIALRHAREAGAERITDVHLVIGNLSSIVDDSVQFYWDIVAAGTPAEGARLHFRRVPIEISCLDCGSRFTPGTDDLACPACHGNRIQIVAGEEFYLEAIDVDNVLRDVPHLIPQPPSPLPSGEEKGARG